MGQTCGRMREGQSKTSHFDFPYKYWYLISWVFQVQGRNMSCPQWDSTVSTSIMPVYCSLLHRGPKTTLPAKVYFPLSAKLSITWKARIDSIWHHKYNWKTSSPVLQTVFFCSRTKAVRTSPLNLPYTITSPLHCWLMDWVWIWK